MKKIGKLMALALALSLLLCACGEKKNAFETAQQMIGENLTALMTQSASRITRAMPRPASETARTASFPTTALRSTPTARPMARRRSTM